MVLRAGAIWTKAPISFDWWEVEITFRITGRGRIGADGMVNVLFENPSTPTLSQVFHNFVLTCRLSGIPQNRVTTMALYLVARTSGLVWEFSLTLLTTITNIIILTSWRC